MTAVSYQNDDNFVRNLVTVDVGGGVRTGYAQPGLRRRTFDGPLPLSVEALAEDLRIDAPEDELETIERMARGAAAFIERRTAYVLIPGEYEIVAGQWWSGAMTVHRGPFREVVAVEYQGQRGVWTPIDAADYWTTAADRDFDLRLVREFDRPALWQPEACVRVRFSAGFDAADASTGEHPIDPGLVTVFTMLVGHYYRNRELFAAGKLEAIELGAGSLLGSYRTFW